MDKSEKPFLDRFHAGDDVVQEAADSNSLTPEFTPARNRKARRVAAVH